MKCEPTGTMWICQDCMILLANGDVSPDHEDPDSLLSKFEGMQVTMGPMEHNGACDDTSECYCAFDSFSTSQCEGCGSYLHGERHAVTGWIEPETRKLRCIAAEVYSDWDGKGKGVNYAAKPYLEAMLMLDTVDDSYGYDNGKSVVLYFLSNAASWRGDVAKRVKAELKAMVK